MNSLIETLNRWGGRVPDFAWPMLWQSSVLIAVLFVFDFVARRKVRASIRYALWLVVLVKLLLPPTLALPTSLAWWVRPSATAPKPQPKTTAFVVTYGDFVPANFPTPPQPVFVPPPKPYLSGAGQAAATWAVVGAGLLVWLVVRWRQVAGNVRQAAVAPALLTEVLDEPQQGIKVPRRVRLLVTNRAISPAVCGLFRPVILLPNSLVERLTPSQLRAVLLHELTHLRRGDVWVNCAQALLQIFYWWHPLLWLANARIRRVREEAVDDAVMLALRDDAETYAPTLLEVAKLAFNRPLASLGLVGIMESRSALRQRIERLVDFRPPRKAGLTIASAFCVLAFAVFAVPMEPAPTTSATQVSTQKQTESTNPPPVELSNTNEEVKLRMIVLNKPIGGDAAEIRKRAQDILAKVKGGAAFSEMASVYSEGRQGREGGDWGWVQKYDRDGALVLRKELTDVAFSLKSGELSGVIETPEVIYLMLVEDKRPVDIKSPNAHERLQSNRTNPAENEMLVTRTLKFDPEVFLPNLRQKMHLPDKSTDTEAIHALPKYLAEAGLDLRSPYTYFVKERGLALFHAPQEKIEAIERLFTELNNGRAQSEIPVPWRPPDRETIIRKLDQIRIDSPAYNETPLIEVIRDLSWETKHQDPERKGLSFHIKYSAELGKMVDLSAVKVTVPPIFYARPSDILEAIIKGADKPIEYFIGAGVTFYSPEDEPLGMKDGVPVLGDIPLVGKLFRTDSAAAMNGAFSNALPKSLYQGTPGPQYAFSGKYYQVELREDGSYWAAGKRMNLEELRDWLVKTKQSSSNTSIGFEVNSNAPPEAVRALTELRNDLGLVEGAASALPASLSPEQFQTRTFKVDPNTFYKGLESVSPLHLTRTNVSVAVATFFSTLGVDLASPSAIARGKAVFWSDRNGALLVRATKEDLDTIGVGIESLLAASDRNIEAERGAVVSPTNALFTPTLLKNAQPTVTATNTALETRLYRLVAPAFLKNLQRQIRESPNAPIQQIITNHLASAGVNLQPPNLLVFNERNGTLVVRASPLQHELLEQLVEQLNSTPPQIGMLNGSPAAAAPLPSSSHPGQLNIRNFRVDPNTFYKGLERVSQLPINQTNASAAMRDHCAVLGVDLSPPKSIIWNDRSGILRVSATKQDLDIIEAAVNALNRVPPQINIKVKFIEMPEQAAETLWHDWMLTNGVVTTDQAAKMSPVQTVRMVEHLKAQKGVDILSSPEVTTVSGRRAQVQVVDLRTIVTGDVNSEALSPPGVTSTNVFMLQQMQFGTTFDVVPVQSSYSDAIHLTITATVTAFLGYDEPNWTNSVIVYVDGKKKTVNPALPHIRTRMITTDALVGDGKTLVIRGSTTEDVVRVKDKVPVLGDIPLAGRLFRSESITKQRKTLMILVTPALVDPAGYRLHNDNEPPSGTK